MIRNRARFLSVLFFVGLVASVLSATAAAQSLSPREQLQQYVAELQKKPNDQALREKIIKLALTLEPKPAIPEEARRHFVRANTALKDAKDASDYDRAIARYNDALLLAPWWPEPYFNLAKTLELRERYDDAIAALKLYVLVGPQGEDARAAQDMIYVLEDKKERTTRVAEAEKRKQEKERAKQAYLEKLNGGQWLCHDGYPFRISLEVRDGVLYLIQVDKELGKSGTFPKGRIDGEDRSVTFKETAWCSVSSATDHSLCDVKARISADGEIIKRPTYGSRQPREGVYIPYNEVQTCRRIR